jgi:hypothetical protein
MSQAQDAEWAEVFREDWKPEFRCLREGLEVRYLGTCPRCGHEMSFEITAGFPAAPPDAPTYRSDPEEQFTMFCTCGHPHPGHPEGDNSCGAFWRYAPQ